MHVRTRIDYVRVVGLGLAIGSTLLVTACDMPGAIGAGGEDENASPTVPSAELAFSVEDGGKGVKPDERLTVQARQGDLVSVRLQDPKGTVIPGKVSDGVWSPSADMRLKPSTTYTWKATAKNAEGATSQQSVSFSTLDPGVKATYTVTPDGSTVGVGMPAMVTFDSAVTTPEMRAEVEKRMKIKVVPAQKGSWGWLDERQLMWRPDSYWKPNTKVTVSAPLTGVATGPDKYIVQDKGGTFTVAKRARIMKVDLAGHTMSVSDNGKRVASYPISAGKPTADWETRSGTKVITEKHEDYVMDAGTLGLKEGDANYYRTEVRYAMRVTNTGEFLHAAPWSVWAQGRRNVSHGCVNLGPGAAADVFRGSIIGDVVEFTGSSRRMKPGDGLSVWLFSADEWHARSALAKKTSSSTGSPTSKKSSTSSSSSSTSSTPPAPSPSTSTTTP